MSEQDNDCFPGIPEHCNRASQNAADNAVKKVFAILGVDVDKPESVEDFRKDLRFGARMRKYADHGFLAFIAIVSGAVALALWEGVVSRIKGMIT